MVDLFIAVVEVSVTTSVLIITLKMLSGFLNKRYVAKWKSILWLLIAIRLLIPYNISLPNVLMEVQVPHMGGMTQGWNQDVMVNAQVINKDTLGQDVEHINSDKKISSKTQVSRSSLVTIIWILGCLLFLIQQFIGHQAFKRRVMRWSRLCKDTWIIELEKQLVLDMGLGKVPPIRIYEEILSPSIMGVFNPILLLPTNKYTVKELTFILRHELVHYKRGDMGYKLMVLIANGIHWFNPFVWLMRRETNVDLELSCDDEVIHRASVEERKAYSETIFACIHQQKERQGSLTTYFFGGTKILKERFKNILSLRKKKNGIILVIVLFVIIIGSGSLIVFINSSEQNQASEVLQRDNEVVEEVNNNRSTEKVEGVIMNDSNCVFEGKIGTQNIYMAIYRDGEQLTASYITQNDDEGEINLQGTVQINTASFILYSEDNNTTFVGIIKPDTVQGELLEGIYTSSKNQTEIPFVLALSHTIGNTFETRYPLVASDTDTVEGFARKIKRYIIDDNKKDLAKLVVYPISITINDSETSINNAEEFEHNYDNIMNTAFKKSVSKSYTKYMNSNHMGIMLGYGVIWFDDWDEEGLRIYAINN